MPPGPKKAAAAQKEIPLVSMSQQSGAVEQSTRDSFNEENSDSLGLMSHIRNETHHGPSKETLPRAVGVAVSQVVPLHGGQSSLLTDSGKSAGHLTKAKKSVFAFMMPSFLRKRDHSAAYLHAQMYGDLSVLQLRAQHMVDEMDNAIAKQNAIVAINMQNVHRRKATKGIG